MADNNKSRRRDNGASRRDFLGMLGIALGGVTLAGCGSGGGTAPSVSPLGGSGGSTTLDADPFRSAVVPNGWQFDSLLPIGRAVELGNINEITPIIGINESGQIFMYAITASGFGIFEVDTTTRNARRSVTGLRPIVQTGDVLPDGRTVGRLGNFDFNDAGTVAFITQPSSSYSSSPGTTTREQDADGVYIERSGGAASPLLVADEVLPGTTRTVGGVFGDVDISNGDNILVTGLVENVDDDSSSDSLIYMPNASNPQVVVSQGEAIPGSNQTVNSLGLVDAGMNSTGYTVQLETADGTVANDEVETRAALSRRDVSRNRSRVLLVNRMGAPLSDGRVIHASGSFRSTRDVTFTSGAFSFGARMGNTVGNDAHAAIVETSPGVQSVQVNGHLIGTMSNPALTGSLSPRGHHIVSIGPPVIGDNLLFFTVITDEGMEVIATNMTTYKTIIGYGDKIGSQTVNSLALGWHPDQLNLHGTMIIHAEMTDGTETILEGKPT